MQRWKCCDKACDLTNRTNFDSTISYKLLDNLMGGKEQNHDVSAVNIALNFSILYPKFTNIEMERNMKLNKFNVILENIEKMKSIVK